MRLTIVTLAAIALVGCNKAEAPADTNAAEANAATADANADLTATPAAAGVTANGSTPGTYDVTAKDGTKSQTTLLADGTYVDTDAAGKETAKGTWVVTEGKTCFDPEGEAAMCFTETAPGADGTFTATPDKGDPVTVKKAG
jgi:hypothetical protein